MVIAANLIVPAVVIKAISRLARRFCDVFLGAHTVTFPVPNEFKQASSYSGHSTAIFIAWVHKSRQLILYGTSYCLRAGSVKLTSYHLRGV
jgi:hypothetical protein